MFNVDKNRLRGQTGSRNLMVPSIVAEKNVTNNILEGRTYRGKTVYPPPPSGSGGIIKQTHKTIFIHTWNDSEDD